MFALSQCAGAGSAAVCVCAARPESSVRSTQPVTPQAVRALGRRGSGLARPAPRRRICAPPFGPRSGSCDWTQRPGAAGRAAPPEIPLAAQPRGPGMLPGGGGRRGGQRQTPPSTDQSPPARPPPRCPRQPRDPSRPGSCSRGPTRRLAARSGGAARRTVYHLVEGAEPGNLLVDGRPRAAAAGLGLGQEGLHVV